MKHKYRRDTNRLKHELEYAERNGDKRLADWCRKQIERRKA